MPGTVKYLVLVFFAAIAGCQASHPNVQYRAVCNPAKDSQCDASVNGIVKFNLPKSLIVLIAKDETLDPELQKPIGVVAPAEWDGPMIEMLKDDPWGRNTALTFTKRESTNLLLAINATVKDNRHELIEKWGVIGVKLIAVLAPMPVCIDECGAFPDTAPEMLFPLPVSIDTAPLMAGMSEQGGSLEAEVSAKASPDTKAKFRFTAGPIPQDAIALNDYLRMAKGKRKHELITSVCRSVQVSFDKSQYSPLGGTSWSFTVADPNYIQTINFPSKGSMTAQSVCGFDVTNTTAVVDPTTEILGASLNQIKSLADAWSTYKSSIRQ